MKEIHINCDLGEGGSLDKELMPLISACNIACGGHAGTLESMHETVIEAIKNNVEIGAHPSYPDKENFGRRRIEIPAEQLKLSIVAQILSLKQIVEAEGGTLNHVKPHGALYNEAAKDEKTAQIIIDAILEFDEDFILYAPQNSVISKLAESKIKVVFEAFADRNYNPNYSLISRDKKDALLTDKDAVFKHLNSMFFNNEIHCPSGEKLPSIATTFCLHSDTPNSVKILHYLNAEFLERNVKIFKK